MNYKTRTHPRAKRLTLRLDKAGQPVVTVPRFTPKLFVDAFVRQQRDWIATQQHHLHERQAEFVSDQFITVFGKQYQRKTDKTESASRVAIRGKTLTIYLHQPAKANQVLEKFLKNTATRYIIPRVHQLAKQMKVKFNKVSLRSQSTRWGSCSNAGNLSFNWKMVHFTPEIIDYVIIHELAHLKHLDHSKKFWQFVEQFDPEFKLHRGWLKRQGIGVN